MIVPWTAEERANLLATRSEALERRSRALIEAATFPPRSAGEAQRYSEAAAAWSVAESAEQEYFERLPRLPIADCPFCGQTLMRTFDPIGLDGLWWRPDARPDEAPACPHFCFMQGALDFAGRTPEGPPWAVYPGPAVPYVVPRILAKPDVVAIVAQLVMDAGFLAFPIAYFAKRRPPPQELAADWARTHHVYKTQLGELGWRLENDAWDLDLDPWLAEGKLQWCESGSTAPLRGGGYPLSKAKLAEDGERVVLIAGRLHRLSPPDGTALAPLEWRLRRAS